MSMQRRVGRLEAAKPEHPMSTRVVFTRDGGPTPAIEPPLRPNEMLLTVNFVDPRGARHG
jgi:hypothetical protein